MIALEKNMARYTLRVDRELLEKFRYVSNYEGRSANRQLEQYIIKSIREFEKEHGEITLPEKEK